VSRDVESGVCIGECVVLHVESVECGECGVMRRVGRVCCILYKTVHIHTTLTYIHTHIP